MPQEWKPIIPVRRPDAFDDPRWAFELKYDGFRAVAHIDLAQGACTFYSRNNKEMKRFRALGERIVRILRESRPKPHPKQLVLDGEIVVFDHETGMPRFEYMMRNRGKQSFVAFDLLILNGKSIARRKFEERRALLEKIVPKGDPTLCASYLRRKEGTMLFEVARRMDLEGIIAKRLQDTYSPDTVWFKIMNPKYSQIERGAFFRNSK